MAYRPRISDEAVLKATGKGWSDWFAFLSQEGASELSHKNIVKLLERDVASPWWRGSIAMEYEYAHGMRKVGQTKDVGYEIGAQQMIHAGRGEIWNLLTSPKGLAIWLGKIDRFDAEPGFAYETANGTTGEVRTVKDGQRIRLTWKPKGWERASTLQITLSCRRNTTDKTNVAFHQEKLGSVEDRERMREHWKSVLERIASLVELGDHS